MLRSALEARDVTPCGICGGWPEIVAKFVPSAEFREWRLPTGQVLVLCKACELEEFMVPGGRGFQLGLGCGRLPINALKFVRAISAPVIARDKFCTQCNLRLGLLEIVATLAPSE